MGFVPSAVLVLAGLFFFSGCKPAARSTTAAPEALSDVRLEKMTVSNYGLSGLQWKMAAPIGKMYTGRGYMQVKNMKTQIYREGKKSADVRSDEAYIRPQDDSVGASTTPFTMRGVVLEKGDMLLDGNVVVVSTSGTTLTTDWMHYRRTMGRVQSTARVRIVESHSVLDGVGFDATPDLSHVEVYKQILTIPEKDEPAE